MKYLRLAIQKYHCYKGRHIYYGIPNGTACWTCKWKDV